MHVRTLGERWRWWLSWPKPAASDRHGKGSKVQPNKGASACSAPAPQSGLMINALVALALREATGGAAFEKHLSTGVRARSAWAHDHLAFSRAKAPSPTHAWNHPIDCVRPRKNRTGGAEGPGEAEATLARERMQARQAFTLRALKLIRE